MSALRFAAALVLAVLVWIAAAAVWIWWQTRDLGAAAGAVVEDWKAADYESLFLERGAPILREVTNEADMEVLSEALGLRGGRIDVTGRGYMGRLGWVQSRVVDRDRRSPMTLLFERRDGRWLLRGVTSPVIMPGLDEIRKSPPRPLLAEVSHRLMRLFAIDVKAGSLSSLQHETAYGVKDTMTLGRLNEAFSGFIDQEIDLRAILFMQPELDEIMAPPPNGLEVRVRGHYPTEPPIRFEFTLVREGAGLPYTGLNIWLGAANQEPGAGG